MSDSLEDPVDQKAMEYCLGVLRDDPDAHYKEVRRAARADKGITLKRHVWTLARQQLGLKGDEDGGEETTERESTPAPRSAAPQQQAPWQNRGAPPPRARWPEPSAPPQWDSAAPNQGARKRPAWAMPQSSSAPERPSEPARSAPSGGPAKTPRQKELPEILKQARNPVEFMVGYLQRVSRDASFAEVEEAAEEFGFTVYPTTFGRAQAIVGIVEAPVRVVPASVAAAAAAAAAPAAPATPSPAPQAAAPQSSYAAPTIAPAASASADPLDGLLNYFVALDRRASGSVQARRLIQQMLHAVDEALHEPVASASAIATPETTPPTP